MHELDDHALLRHYAEQNSEAAFAAIVARHVDKVYSTALRHTRNTHAAEEITQAVFVILARKSGRLGGQVILSGWLYETARLTALTHIRSEIRRTRREQEAHMQTALNENDSEVWPHIAPLLDDALAKLSAADRHAVVLRYFDGKSLGEVGAALGASEDAAKKRVTRAVEKLRGFFTKRGVTLTATVLTAAISANSVQAAPLGLAATVTATAAKSAVVSGSTLTIIKGALKIMAWTKAKMAIVVGVGVLLAAGTTTVVVKHIHNQAVVFSPADSAKVDDSFFFPNSDKLFKLPPTILIFRQSHFAQNRGAMTATKSGFIQKPECRLMGAGQSLSEALAMLYQISAFRIILPSDSPTGRFDYMATLPATSEVQQCKRLQDEMTQQIGLAGRKASREMDAFLLQVKTTEAPGLSPHIAKDYGMQSRSGKTYCNGQSMDTLAYLTENTFKQVVIDRTGLNKSYDYVLDDAVFNGNASRESVEKYLLEHFGLELVPSREPVEMLVVEKVK